MNRSALALVLVVAFSLVGFGWRTVVQVRRHGDTGWRFDRTGADRVVGPLLALSFGLLLAAPTVAWPSATRGRPSGSRHSPAPMPSARRRPSPGPCSSSPEAC